MWHCHTPYNRLRLTYRIVVMAVWDTKHMIVTNRYENLGWVEFLGKVWRNYRFWIIFKMCAIRPDDSWRITSKIGVLGWNYRLKLSVCRSMLSSNTKRNGESTVARRKMRLWHFVTASEWTFNYWPMRNQHILKQIKAQINNIYHSELSFRLKWTHRIIAKLLVYVSLRINFHQKLF